MKLYEVVIYESPRTYSSAGFVIGEKTDVEKYYNNKIRPGSSISLIDFSTHHSIIYITPKGKGVTLDTIIENAAPKPSRIRVTSGGRK